MSNIVRKYIFEMSSYLSHLLTFSQFPTLARVFNSCPPHLLTFLHTKLLRQLYLSIIHYPLSIFSSTLAEVFNSRPSHIPTFKFPIIAFCPISEIQSALAVRCSLFAFSTLARVFNSCSSPLKSNAPSDHV